MISYQNFLNTGFGLAVFSFFALSLAVPSGYSYGSSAMALLALASLLHKPRQQAGMRETGILLASLAAIGLIWAMGYGSSTSAGLDYGAKYALAGLSLWVLSRSGLCPRAVVWGLAAGSVGALGVAAYQYLVLHLTKASGFTNAIQYGGIAMYMGIACWALAVLGRWRGWQIGLLALCGGAGVLASLLSESRGSWVTVPLLLAAIWIMAWRNGHRRSAFVAVVVILAGCVALALPAYQKLEKRAALAVQEARNYQLNPAQYAQTSIGQRLEQWRLALRLIEEKPLAGWGLQGYVRAKQELVDQGLAHPSVMDYGHAHNEILDMWAKRGLAGLLVLLFFYAAPLYVFWPNARRLAAVAAELRPRALALRAAAALLPLAYFGFGWTQVFFAHNSGHLFYTFSLAAFWGAICFLERPPKDCRLGAALAG
ncbi:O-antigen ligase family protein [Comamonas composti]|uniref:O-antigen ligase family protein n=1 Tax=Comamonas composti TaxID=408558 RepID=UPI001FE129BC|nr:O-antigen ligase family protein [Comamonas composti]